MSGLLGWLDRLKNRQAANRSPADYRRNEALELLASSGDSATWIDLSRHYNGFVREVAVRELSHAPSPQALVALIDRLNDWVPQVRDLAATEVNRYLSASHAQALLFALDPLLALEARQRVDHGPTLMAARVVLQTPAIRDEVYRNFLTRQGRAARYLFELLLEGCTEAEALLSSALAHRELTVRLMAVSACSELAPCLARPLLAEAAARPGASVRVRALRALMPLLEDPRAVLSEALLDASPAIRCFARWAASRNNLDAVMVLHTRLSQARPCTKRGWLGVLGLAKELDVELDSRWLMEALSSAYPTVRHAAVGLLRDEHLPQLIDAMDDPSGRVFDAAIVRLRSQPWSTLAPELEDMLAQRWHGLPPARREAMLHLLPSWQQLAFLLARLGAKDEVQAFWLRQLVLWCDRQYLMVDPVTPQKQREAISDELKHLVSRGLLRSDSVQRVIG